MEKRILNDIKDFWKWREDAQADVIPDFPMAEDMPNYYPCAVVWHNDSTNYTDNVIYYGFVYVTEILGLI